MVFLVVPIYLTFTNAFKENRQIVSDFFNFPNPFTTWNFERLFNDGVIQHFWNSTVITVTAVALILLILPMAAFAISREKDRGSKVFSGLYFLLLIGIFVPFQIIMIPLTGLLMSMNLANMYGLLLIYVTAATPQAIFLYSGFIKAVIPTELDEAATLDGCGKFRMYFQIMFPLLKPMHATILILNSLFIWNDFQMPLILLNRNQRHWTLPLFQYNYQTRYLGDLGPAFAAFAIGIAAIMVVYFIFQKHIVAGLSQGSIK